MKRTDVYYYEKHLDPESVIEYRFWKHQKGWHFIKTIHGDKEPRTIEMYLPEEVIQQVLTDSVVGRFPPDSVPRDSSGKN